jgi:CPA2 family monovalent cation:H+ antiporter-2
LTPWLIRASDPVATYVDRHLPKPVQTFAALYGTWVEQLRRRPREATTGRRIRRLSRLLVLDGVSLGAIVTATSVWGPGVTRLVGSALTLPESVQVLPILIAAGALAVPFCVGIARCTSALAHLLATTALPRAEGNLDTADAPLVITIEIAILLLIGVPLVALTQPFLPPFPGAAVMAVVIALLAFALWRSMANLQEHARAGAQAIVEVLARQSRSENAADPSAEDLAQLNRLLPGLGAPVAIRLRADSPAAGRTLAELNLRGLTGATVLAVVRGADGVLIPTGTEKLYPDDLLATTGTADAIDAARRLLSGRAAPP